ncbi:hypothetical protein GJ496_009831 [Pomphorhynchus laevis]|nr:hypothetical protein GJ496_009831 [Pomphorhynchus laevis]
MITKMYDDRNHERSSSLEKLFNDLNTQTCSYNSVRFLSYRIALKVRALITKFKLVYVDYKIALFQLNQEGIAFGSQFVLPIERVRHIIRTIYQSLPPVHFTDISIKDLTEGLCAVFARILDNDRSNSSQFDSDSFKLVFFSLLNMNLTLKYMYLYQMMCFPSSTISVSQVRLIFKIMAKIAMCLDNNINDVDSYAETLVDGILCKAAHKSIDKSTFLDFLNDRPLELEWMHSLHTLLLCATVRHEAQCDVCGTYPIIGIRFRCLCCFDYDLCATCHFLGSFSKDHLPGHEIQQLTKQVKPYEDFKAFVEIIRRRLLRSSLFSSKYKTLTFNRTNSENSS